MRSLHYAINEGLKLSWKVGLIGGIIGSTVGYNNAQEMVKKDPSSAIVAIIFFGIFPAMGVAGGTIGGFVCGVAKGGIEWAIKGPFNPHSPDDVSIRLGAKLIAGVAEFFFKRNAHVN